MSITKEIEDLVVQLHKIGAVKFGNFKLKVGIMSPVYVDLRVIISYPKLMSTLCNLLIKLIDDKSVSYDHICGVPYTALPIASVISVETGKPMVIRRKEAKDYGTKKMIEGDFKDGQSCIIIEDIISSGSSVLETVRDLENVGLIAKTAVVVLNREQGGYDNLSNAGIQVHTLLSISQVIAVLLSKDLITKEVASSVTAFIKETQINTDGTNKNAVSSDINERLSMSLSQRAKLCVNPVTKRLLQVMNDKKSLLAVAADVTTAEELISVAQDVGEHVAVLKLHCDAIQDFSPETANKLKVLADDHNFIIMEDRKFADIGNTVSLQYSRIKDWAELVTVHSLPGPSVINGLKKAAGSDLKGAFLVAELSSEGALTSPLYAKETVKMAEENEDFVVGLVCQSSNLIKNPTSIQLTPGVQINALGDDLGQKYVTPETAVLEKGADLVVVGRGIICASNRRKTAETYKHLLWDAYCSRVKK